MAFETLQRGAQKLLSRYVLIVGTTIPVINIQSHLINKIPSYFPIRHRKYVFTPGCDLDVRIVMTEVDITNALPSLLFPQLIIDGL